MLDIRTWKNWWRKFKRQGESKCYISLVRYLRIGFFYRDVALIPFKIPSMFLYFLYSFIYSWSYIWLCDMCWPIDVMWRRILSIRKRPITGPLNFSKKDLFVLLVTMMMQHSYLVSAIWSLAFVLSKFKRNQPKIIV